MKNGSTLRVGLDVHKESIAVAYAGGVHMGDREGAGHGGVGTMASRDNC